MEKDTYKTIKEDVSGALFKDKGSKFIGYAFHITTEEQVKEHLETVKKEHHSARHWCYAWQIGTEQIQYRANDDGEPSNSAGQPIYGQILSKEVTNVLIIVVRYFGGIKLGVGGLINAYKTTAKLILDEAEIIEKTIDVSFKIKFEYKNINNVMRILKESTAEITGQKMELDCEYFLRIRKAESEALFNRFSNLYGVEIVEVES